MSAQTRSDFQDLIDRFYKEITDDEFFYRVNMAAEDLAYKKNFKDAIGVANRNKQLAELIPDKSYMGWLYFTYGRIYDIKGDADSCSYYYESAIPFFEISGDVKGTAVCWNNLATIYQQEQKYSESLVFFSKARGAKTSLIGTSRFYPANDYYSLALTELGIGLSNFYLANYDSAITAYQRGLEWCDLSQSLKAKTFAADLYTEIARVHKKRGEYEQALNIYKKQLQQNRELGDELKVADAIDNIADVQFRLGDYKSAFSMYYDAYNIKLKVEQWNEAGFSMSGCGQAMWNLGDLDSAITCHNLSVDLRVRGENKSGQAYSISKMAKLYNEIGQPDNAEKRYQQAINLYLELGDSVELATISKDVGEF